MVTPVFRISDYLEAREFYISWLGFRIDWEDRPANGPDYVQVSRGDLVLHLSSHHNDSSPGSKARLEVHGLLAYHHQLLSKEYAYLRPTIGPAHWHDRVLEMEVTDPFGNRLVFCELGVLNS